MAPYALTTHFKNYRILRTPAGLALENCSLGEGDIDLAAIAETRARHRPETSLNIEIHSQFAPFKLDILSDGYWKRHPSPPGDGLSWYLGKSWPRPLLDRHPANLPDGPASWELEREHLVDSIRWAQEKLGHLLN